MNGKQQTWLLSTRSDKQILKNDRTISLLPICGKSFEHLKQNRLFEYFIENDLISPSQSGFKPRDSCANQLISITHEIYQSSDDGFEVRGDFLDITKIFDTFWHNGLTYKVKQTGVPGDSLDTLTNFLKQRVVLNGQHSTLKNVEAGVPHGSFLGLLLFLIYINDFPENLVSNPTLFADDTSLFSAIRNKQLLAQNLNEDLTKRNFSVENDF